MRLKCGWHCLSHLSATLQPSQEMSNAAFYFHLRFLRTAHALILWLSHCVCAPQDFRFMFYLMPSFWSVCDSLFQGAGTERSGRGARATPGSAGFPILCTPPNPKPLFWSYAICLQCRDFSTTEEPACTLLKLTAKVSRPARSLPQFCSAAGGNMIERPEKRF